MQHSLDLIGLMDGTDKSSLKHDYLRHYEYHFRDFRNEELTLIEIGVLGGASLKTWSKFFPKATIVGVDIKPKCMEYAAPPRVLIEIGSQNDPGFLADLARKYKPKIIIDDGSHIAEHIIFTFETLFPHLQDGGIYVIEDMHFHLGDRAQAQRGNSLISPTEYVERISTRLQAGWVGNKEPEFQKYLFDHVDTITAVPRAAFIRKTASTSPAQIDEMLSQAERIAKNSGAADVYDRVAGLMITHNASLPRAERLARKAVEIDPNGADFHHRLSVILRRDKRPEEAMEASKRAVSLSRRNAIYFNQLGTLQLETGHFSDAVEAFKEAITINPRQAGFHERLADAYRSKGDIESAVEAMTKAVAMMEGGSRHAAAVEKLKEMRRTK